MQCPSHWIGQRARHTHRVIFLETRYRLAHLIGENAVNRPTIVSEPAQIPWRLGHRAEAIACHRRSLDNPDNHHVRAQDQSANDPLISAAADTNPAWLNSPPAASI